MIAEPIVFLNIFCALISVWAGMYVNAKFLRPVSLNVIRFRLYELRDALAIMAMKGEIEESSEEYTTLRDLINASLASTKDFRITNFIRVHFDMANSEDLQSHVKHIIAKIGSHEMPTDYQDIVRSYFEANGRLYKRQTRLLRVLLLVLLVLLSPLLIVLRSIKVCRSAKVYIDRQKKKVATIDDVLEDHYQHLRRA